VRGFYPGGQVVRVAHVGHPFLWGLVGLVLVAGAVVVIVMLLLRLAGRWGAPPVASATRPVVPPSPGPGDPAVGYLRWRYARGEIGRDDYFRMAADLGVPVPTQPPPPPAAPPSPSPSASPSPEPASASAPPPAPPSPPAGTPPAT